MAKLKTLCFDIDGVICTITDGDYMNAKPYTLAIEMINKLYDSGYQIEIFTARFMGRCKGNALRAHELGYDFTYNQLIEWGCKFHVLNMGKPIYDLLVDDRALFFDEKWTDMIEDRLVSSDNC